MTVTPDIVQLWDQAMSLGEDKGKEAYKEFLDKWRDFQKNPPPKQGPTKWQQQLLQKQHEVIQTARRKNITLPQELTRLWEQAISSEGEEGRKAYDQFLKAWDELEKAPPKSEPLAGQYVDPSQYRGDYNYQNTQGMNYGNQYHPSYNQGYGPYGQWQPNPYSQPVQGYPYSSQYPPYQGNYPYQPSHYREPFAGQQQSQQQAALQEVQQEIVQWAQQNGVQLPVDVVMAWEDAMRAGTQEAYDQFMQMWNKYKQDNTPQPQPQSQNYQGTQTSDSTGEKKKKRWKTALINQIEGQNIVARMLGINTNDLAVLKTQIEKLDKDSMKNIIDAVMNLWNKINNEIDKSHKEDR